MSGHVPSEVVRELLDKGNVYYDLDDPAAAILAALVTDERVAAGLTEALDSALAAAVCDPLCYRHLHGVRLAREVILAYLTPPAPVQ